MWLVGVVSRRRVLLVVVVVVSRMWVESMGVASGSGCKEVYRFPHITCTYTSCICSFLQQHPYFLIIFLCFSFLIIMISRLY